MSRGTVGKFSASSAGARASSPRLCRVFPKRGRRAPLAPPSPIRRIASLFGKGRTRPESAAFPAPFAFWQGARERASSALPGKKWRRRQRKSRRECSHRLCPLFAFAKERAGLPFPPPSAPSFKHHARGDGQRIGVGHDERVPLLYGDVYAVPVLRAPEFIEF